MASGDAQRTWFPEMLDVLRKRWRGGLPFEEWIRLAGELDEMLQRARAMRRIQRPIFRCLDCGHVAQAAEVHVTVRAMILSLGRFRIVPMEEMKQIERSWAAHRKQHGLDLYGKVAEAATEGRKGCEHQTLRQPRIAE
jgi:hypothetical protein